MSTSMFCIATTDLQAAQVVTGLRDAGFPEADVSVLCADATGGRRRTHERQATMPGGATAGAGTGGVVGGVLGWLAGTGMIALPGIGALVAAGPLLGALSGVAGGAAVGGLIGALVGLGMPEDEATRYERRIRAGDILIAVHTETSDERSLVEEVFRQAGAEDVSSSEDTRPPHAHA